MVNNWNLNFWRNLSVSKKLYSVFGVMAFLILFELLALSFAMDTISSVRAFVGGEGLWSKAQKDAVNSLQRYIFTKEEEDFQTFKDFLKVPLGDHWGRLELEKPPGERDEKKMYEGFLQGRNHYDDIGGMIRVLTRFQANPYIAEAVQKWIEADALIFSLMELGDEIHAHMQTGNYSQKYLLSAVQDIHALNTKLTRVEDRFSSVLAEGSRWLERTLFFILLLLVLTVECTGLFFTFSFSRYLSKGLKDLNASAIRIGEGFFDRQVDIRSQDELGQLASSLNKMVESLKSNVGRRIEAEHHSRAKDLFLANMSHEIRTPLGAILGFTELLQDSNLSETDREKYFEIIKRSGENLTTIIGDILDISRIESGHLVVEKESFSLGLLLEDVEKWMRLKCEEKGNLFKLEMSESLPEQVYNDSTRLKQIILNLLNNAGKFTEAGVISLKVSAEGDFLLFDIRDTGIGIPAEDQAKVFAPFVQADNSFTRKFGGIGLGLPLSRDLAKLLGGDLGLVASEENKGSHFQVRIPYARSASSRMLTSKSKEFQDDKLKERLRGLKLLIIEDSEDTRHLVEIILRKYGCELDFAENGQEGVRKALNGNYDLILMDIQMPVMDGYEAAKSLRNLSYRRPIIALTAHAMAEDKKKCLDAGCTDYLTKPVNKDQLVQKVAEYSIF